jgi:UDP-N-acetylglucosamine--N-acetylmuramyl-(pentapeptide) pyrophosphoryl-undecaprenol N-acetylglucosamine transferase
VIGVGGYSTFPVLKYAQSKNIPTFIHESNSLAGKSNIMLGKKATKIFVASDGMGKFFPAEKIYVTGNPVRKSIADATVEIEKALAFFGLKNNIKTVLSIGGSLGAKSMNEAIAANINVFEKNNVQLIWQTGKVNAEKYKTLAAGNKNIWMNEFIQQMEMAYAAADIIISRAGAMSVAELCMVGKPVVFVPFPFAAEDHQTANAMNLVNKQAALIVKDNEVNEKLIDTIMTLYKDELLQQTLQKNIQSLAIKNADEKIVNEILSIINA